MLQAHRIEQINLKVQAVNAANKMALELYPKLVEVFQPLVGKKILKADGTILEKYKKLMPELPNTPSMMVYRYSSDYNLIWKVDAKVWVDERYNSHEVSIYVGELTGDTLKAITLPVEERRTDWTTEEVVKLVEDMEAKKKVYEDARSKCWLFDEGR